ncbi:DUF3000 family protein [Streptomyces sp. ACA25]|uniref:DUF3000 family protein n=1 Tax=Streptomyces sp. ACA25 TaxID=3022596 RepID=UPI002307E0A4|nr:DUF3000 family protein [Streptomyces sp. ACA25]MDB1089158.1 DUF3000 family protein [Streptomyces sp. ACA25]
MTDPGAGAACAFQETVAALAETRPRQEVRLSPLPPPRRLAPFAYAVEASVIAEDDDEEEELADGRFVLLHDPDGQQEWRGKYRVVTLTRAELEPEVGTDPLLPEVAWTWLTEALDSRGLTRVEQCGTVTRAGSYFFGGLAERPPRTELELRASWTPVQRTDVPGHLLAWCGLLAQCAGLPPESSSPAVSLFPRRRGPRLA